MESETELKTKNWPACGI